MRTAVEPKLLRGFLPADVFAATKSHMAELALRFVGRPPLDEEFGRNYVHNDPPFVELHHRLLPRAAALAGASIKPTYAFASIYGEEGVCPAHTDRPQCQYTLDLCVWQSAPWGLFVDGREYVLEENDALFYSGTGSMHYRDPIAPGNFCMLLFFHFVDEEFEGELD